MTLPVIRSQTHNENQCETVFHIISTDEYFSGHFSGQPIIAGVFQIDWAIKVAEHVFDLNIAQHFVGMDAIKFKNIITPECDLKLVITKSLTHIVFEYWVENTNMSSGKIRFQIDD